jgi:dihydrofolate reductase
MSQAQADERDNSRVHLVAAVASNGVIGAWGKLPWHLPEDLQHFKALTYGHPVIMGRRTWESLGKPLPGRDNIVVTRSEGFEARGASVASSFDAALALCAGSPVAFVIGGGELYAAALPEADVLLLTEIQRDYEGDARFPDIDRGAWQECERVPRATADGLRYDFVRYERAGPNKDPE